jgi:hypothetical protein
MTLHVFKHPDGRFGWLSGDEEMYDELADIAASMAGSSDEEIDKVVQARLAELHKKSQEKLN